AEGLAKAACPIRLSVSERGATVGGNPGLSPSIGVGALDRPDRVTGCYSTYDGDTPDARRLRDLRAVHEPDRHVAAGVLPEEVALAVAIKVAGPYDRPIGRDRTKAGRLAERSAGHQPDRQIASGVAATGGGPAGAAAVAVS